MVFCLTSGFKWSEVYEWNVDEFTEIYHALQRNDARSYLRNFSAVSQAFGGDQKSVQKFVEEASVWLPASERGGGAKGTEDFVDLVKKGIKLKQ